METEKTQISQNNFERTKVESLCFLTSIYIMKLCNPSSRILELKQQQQ